MNTLSPNWLNRLLYGLRLLLVTQAQYYLIAFVAIAMFRMRYPFELEWLEGATVNSCAWLLAGHNLYSAPDLSFVAGAYPPLYFWVSAGLMKVVGIGFIAPRLVSFAAALGCFGLIFLLVRRETGLALAGLASAGLFAATFRVAGAWLDVARVDALFLFLLLLAVYAARRFPGPAGAALSALALVAAYATKQPAPLMMACLAGYYLLEDRRAAAVFGGVALGGGLVFGLAVNWFSQGWFAFYTLEIVRQHAINTVFFYYFWLADFSRVLVMAALAIAFLARLPDTDRSTWRFYGVFAAGMVAMSWAGRLNSGGYDNVLLPAMAALAILAGLTLAWVMKKAAGQFVALALLILSSQFFTLFYNPFAQIPTPADWAAGEQLQAAIRAIPGEVYIPSHSYYTAQAGKQSYADWASIANVSGVMYTGRAGGGPAGGRQAIITRALTQAVAAGRFEAIVLDEPPEGLEQSYWAELLAPHYVLQQTLFSEAGVFWPVTGHRTRPQFIYVRQTP